MQALRLKPLRINNIITTPLIKPEALPNKERPGFTFPLFHSPRKVFPKCLTCYRPAAAGSATFGRE